MDYSKLIDSLTPEMIARFSEAVEIGKWPDGQSLTLEQKENCIQAIMLYKARFGDDSEEPFTISNNGKLHTGTKVRTEYAESNESNKENSLFKLDLESLNNKK